uniref:Protein phosphatase 4 regulatory subunit 4 n=1 Tax=Hucho hucho TaxID=62062 RepID=A0A4W5NL25_9TELE
MFVSKMTLNQSSLFGQVDDLQDLTFIERPIRRSLKTAEEIEKLTVDEDLNDIERAVYLLRMTIAEKGKGQHLLQFQLLNPVRYCSSFSTTFFAKAEMLIFKEFKLFFCLCYRRLYRSNIDFGIHG